MTTNDKRKEAHQLVKMNKEEKPKYNIEKIVVPIQGDLLPDVKIYQDFNLAVIKEMAKENNIKVETKELPTFNDINIALERGDISVIPGIVQTYKKEEFALTYSYFTEVIYRSNGEQLDSEKSYSMLVRKTDEDLYNFFNDMISKFNETGKLKELQIEYLGERNHLK
ncbi:hypothetical protein M3226_05180 [Neobacillus cucumis]|uniref:transporter substrate-binding domain-containing protein n=1 Tax=Neobacillus cucumis TaxID=1740721 RepID=UPI002041A637|nr:hypothetical protein [Neobacillus cucumis]MCM3725090.1 hypothetical protein [Neobacillus cucumis]